jgi:EmrB/QacA subfamily drug resistance transporter
MRLAQSVYAEYALDTSIVKAYGADMRVSTTWLQPPTPTAVVPVGAARWAVVGVVGGAIFIGTFASTVVTLVLPQIAVTFQVAAVGGAEWVLLSFLLALAGLQLLAGRLADVFGRKAVLLWGLALFCITSGLCGVAPTLPLLVVCRVGQGAGGALVLALAVAILADAFPPEELGRAMAWNSVLVGIGTGSGPVLGGLIAQHLGWRWIFLLSVPIGLGIAIVAARVVPAGGERLRISLDLPGAALLALGLVTLMLWLTYATRWGWTSPLFWGFGIAGLAAFAVAARVERHAAQPVLAGVLFQNRLFVKSSISYAASFVCLYAGLLLIPLYLANARGFEPQLTGLLITPLLAMMVVAAPLARALMTRWSHRSVGGCGMVCVAAGLALLSLLSAATPIWLVPVATFLGGLGFGLFYPANNFAYMASAPAARRGVASAFLATLRTVGGSVGTAATTALFAGLGGDTLAAFQPAYQITLLAAAGVAATIALSDGLSGAIWGYRARAAQPSWSGRIPDRHSKKEPHHDQPA